MDHFDTHDASAEELLGMGDTCVSCGKAKPTTPTGHGPMCGPCDEDLQRYYMGDPDDIYFGDDGFMVEMHDDGPVLI